jgi:hypothetical protein
MNDWKTSFKGVSIYAKIFEGLYNLIYRTVILMNTAILLTFGGIFAMLLLRVA